MSAAAIAPGEALALHRRLTGSPDPLGLYAALTDNGRRRDTFLLERTVGPSLLMDQAAARIECDGHEVILAARSEGGRHGLGTVAARLPDS